MPGLRAQRICQGGTSGPSSIASGMSVNMSQSKQGSDTPDSHRTTQVRSYMHTGSSVRSHVCGSATVKHIFCLKGITMASPYRTGPAAKLRIRTYAITDYSYGTSPQTANMVQTRVQRYGLRKQKYVAMFLNVGRFSAFLPVSRYRPP